MKRLIIASICLCLTLFVSGCKNNADNDQISDDISITKYSDATGKYYEETAGGYKAAFYEKDEIAIERIENWISSCEPCDKYYQYIYSDPDSWDMFIYYSPKNGVLSHNNFSFSTTDSIVSINVTSDDSEFDAQADYLLIRIQAPLRGVWPYASELYIDGAPIEMCDSTDHQQKVTVHLEHFEAKPDDFYLIPPLRIL